MPSSVPPPALERLGKLRKEFGKAEGPQGRTSGSRRVQWIRILWKCWQDRTPYDEARYLKRLALKNRSLLKLTCEKSN